jgi:hypothetical protein
MTYLWSGQPILVQGKAGSDLTEVTANATTCSGMGSKAENLRAQIVCDFLAVLPIFNKNMSTITAMMVSDSKASSRATGSW